MTWVLIIFLSNFATSVDFDSKEACHAAQKAITQIKNGNPSSVCAAKTGYLYPIRRAQ